MELAGAVAIVTGASRGVGAATAVELAATGAQVVCAAHATDAEPVPIPGTIDATVRAITDAGGTAVAVPTNLAADADVEAMVDAALDHFGRLDILVNNAAITFPGDIDLPMKRFDLVFDVDLRAPVIAAQRAVPHMVRQGRGAIVNVSSAAALNYYPGQMAYGMAKAALEHFTVSLAAQLVPHAIPVNTFRIDVPVASEGFLAAMPGIDHSDWEPPVVAAEGILWMLRQEPAYTGHNVGMARLRAEQGIMPSRAERPHTQAAGMVTDSLLGTWTRVGPPTGRVPTRRSGSGTVAPMPPAQPRDAQRSRVYRAETPLGGRRLPTLPDCGAFVDDVVGSLWWVARFPEHDLAKTPILRPGNGARHAFYREDPGHPTITLPRRYRTVGVILHELVHWALADAHDLPNHGRTFTRILLDATAEFMGGAKRERLAAAYAEQKVAVAPPPRVGPAGGYDYGWDERLRLGRGRRFVVDYDAEGSAIGMLVSRAHRRVTLEDGTDRHVIPERSIWRVHGARNGRVPR